eukprot:GEMP01044641.1.p1 GENE.GEMP01044641.1~~GEMP01044641.1.p1  ORF type:complete len:264 (+),score=36.05 GEMP01044641.1:158-949(+)
MLQHQKKSMLSFDQTFPSRTSTVEPVFSDRRSVNGRLAVPTDKRGSRWTTDTRRSSGWIAGPISAPTPRTTQNSMVARPTTMIVAPTRVMELPANFKGFSHNDVFLNIYHVRIGVGFTTMDFAGFNSLFDNVLGAFHVGVEIYGEEWQYGWCNDGTGVCQAQPRVNTEHTYSRTVRLGRTKLSVMGVNDVLSKLSSAWPGSDYNIGTKNCIHFAKRFTEELGVEEPPAFLFRLSGLLPGAAPFAASVASSAAPSNAASRASRH